eukprot:TRINITY_DN3326_c0_g1_i1.p1 TRINITY_DN3326_c0_g1~~TRINITY_DN3326_c0_g1_i1.p1  ORF type:complete len:204 (-),score=78.45 TRINITY_DN3326_c0_g1_i1:1109-1690(-)
MATEYKVVVLGGGAVGKSALTVMLCMSHFVEVYDPTIEDSYRCQTEVDGAPCMLDILDTAGQEEFSALRSAYMRSGRGFLLVYSVASRASFDEVANFRLRLYQALDRDFGEHLPVVLCANKCDLAAAQRQVSRDEGEQLAKSYGFQFFETSAKQRTNVDAAFHALVRECRLVDAASKKPTKKKMLGKKSCLLL